MILEGELRRDHSAAQPWQYRSHVVLPAGRTWGIRARIAEDGGHKFFALEFQLIPGMSAAELEAALIECEQNNASRVRTRIEAGGDDELPF